MGLYRMGMNPVEQQIARKLVNKYNQVLRERGEGDQTVSYDSLPPNIKRLVTQIACEGYRHWRRNGRHLN